jgi:hypothetical protein
VCGGVHAVREARFREVSSLLRGNCNSVIRQEGIAFCVERVSTLVTSSGEIAMNKVRLLIAGVCVLAGCTTVHHTPTSSTRCTEDMSCWDCRTMGNGICGRP